MQTISESTLAAARPQNGSEESAWRLEDGNRVLRHFAGYYSIDEVLALLADLRLVQEQINKERGANPPKKGDAYTIRTSHGRGGTFIVEHVYEDTIQLRGKHGGVPFKLTLRDFAIRYERAAK